MTADETRLIVTARRHALTGSGKALREAANLTRSELAEIVGVDESSIWRWEEEQHLPRRAQAIRWARALRRIERYRQRLDAAVA